MSSRTTFDINSWYCILGISKDANIEQIKKAFKQKALCVHPDKNNSPDANAQFRMIKEAYDSLIVLKQQQCNMQNKSNKPQSKQNSSKNKRKNCHETNSTNSSSNQHAYVPNYNAKVYTEYMKKMKGNFNFPNFNWRDHNNNKCNPIHYKMPISFEDILRGTELDFTIIRFDQNFQFEAKLLRVKVPLGTVTGHTVVFAGEGNRAVNTAPGDIIFTFEEKAHPHFQRLNTVDLLYTVNIDFIATLNSFKHHFQIPTLEGHTTPLNVDQLITAATKKRIPGFGLPYLSDSKVRGDIVVKFNIIYPPHLTREKRRELAGSLTLF